MAKVMAAMKLGIFFASADDPRDGACAQVLR
jgi:hypothetical protein